MKEKEEINNYLKTAIDVKEWMENKETTKPPSAASKDSEEKLLGRRLGNLRYKFVKPYKNLKTEEEREIYKKEHPELEKVMQIIEEIDKNNYKTKHLINAIEIQKWMKNNKTTQLPSELSEDEEEKSLGTKLRHMKEHLITGYIELKTQEDKEKYKRKHPEIDDVMKIINELDVPYRTKKRRELTERIKVDIENEKNIKVVGQVKNNENRELGNDGR